MDGFELAISAILNDNISVYLSGAQIDSEIIKNSVRSDSVGNDVLIMQSTPTMQVYHLITQWPMAESFRSTRLFSSRSNMVPCDAREQL